MNIPSFIIALTVIAIGASLPDLLVQMKALKTGHAKLGFGNILGGVASELMLIFGLIALMNPFKVPLGSIMFSGITVFLASIVSILITKKGYITRNNGLFLIGLYLLFIIIEII